MTQQAYRFAPHAREAEIIGRKALDFLGKNRLAPTPRNFELLYEVLTGEDRALREAFVGLPRPFTQASLTMLAQTFLPDRPALAALKTASEETISAFDAFRKALEAGSVSVVEVPEGANDRLTALDAQIGACIDALQSVSRVLTPAPHDTTDQDHLTAQLHFGLPGYAALEQRLDEMFAGGIPEDGVSLMLCRVIGLERLSRSGLAQVGDYMKNTLARFTHRLLEKNDTAYWTGEDELSLLVEASSESYLSQLGEKIVRVVCDAESIARRSIRSMPSFSCHFGCARTHRPIPVAQLYGAARQSLHRAELTGSRVPVFADVSVDQATLRRYEALYGRRMR